MFGFGNFRALAAAAVLAVSAGVASAATTYTYDFQAAADPGGAFGESIWSTFNTDGLGVGGPNLAITARGKIGGVQSDAYAYLDRGNAGMGVCRRPTSAGVVGVKYPNSGTNRCGTKPADGSPTGSSDDSIHKSQAEQLNFKATEAATLVRSVTVNANHDGTGKVDIGDMVTFLLGATTQTFTAAQVYNDDWTIVLNWTVGLGDTLTFFMGNAQGAGQASEMYVTSMAVSQVPVPAAGLMLLGALGGLAALRRRRRMV